MAKAGEIFEEKEWANAKRGGLAKRKMDWDMLPVGAAFHGNELNSGILLVDDMKDTLPANPTENAMKFASGEEQIQPLVVAEHITPKTTFHLPPQSASSEFTIESATGPETFTPKITPAAPSIEEMTSTITISRRQVSASCARQQQPLTEVDRLREEVKSSKHVPAQKAFDLRSSNGKWALDPRAKSWSNDHIIEHHVCALPSATKYRFNASLSALAEVAQEQQKATSELRQQRQAAIKPPEEKHDVNLKLQIEMGRSAALQEEVFKLSTKVDQQAETINLQQSHIEGLENKTRRLEEQLAKQQARLSPPSNQAVAPSFTFSSMPISTTAKEASPEIQSFEKLGVLQMKINGNKFQTSKSRVHELENSLSEATKEIESLRKKAASLRKEVIEKDKMLVIKDAKFLERQSEWDEEMKMKAPLVKLAVDIRLRVFEQYRKSKPHIFGKEVDDAIIQNGNKAAHRAYGGIDAAIFKVGLIPESYLEEAKHVFRKLYQAEPHEYPKLSPKALRHLDCQASIKINQQIPGTEIKSRWERGQWDHLEKVLWDLENRLSRVEFEMSLEAEEHIQKLEQLTDLIIDLDRGRNIRPQDTSPVKNSAADPAATVTEIPAVPINHAFPAQGTELIMDNNSHPSANTPVGGDIFDTNESCEDVFNENWDTAVLPTLDE